MTLPLSIELVPHDSARYHEAVTLRRAVLRRPLGLDFTDDELAAESRHLHLVAIYCTKVVGCLMIVIEPTAGRIRQMAVDENCRGMSIGRLLMIRAEHEIAAMGLSHIVLHARETAMGFYEKLGFVREGARFIEVGIGHYKMTKKIKP